MAVCPTCKDEWPLETGRTDLPERMSAAAAVMFASDRSVAVRALNLHRSERGHKQ